MVLTIVQALYRFVELVLGLHDVQLLLLYFFMLLSRVPHRLHHFPVDFLVHLVAS